MLSACWTSEKSHEFRRGGHSWFSFHLLAALREHPGPALPVTQVWVERMRERTTATAWQDIPEAGPQNPHLVPEDGGGVVLALRSPRDPGSALPTTVLRPSPRRPGWFAAALFFLALLVPIQTASLLGLRLAVDFAESRAGFDLPPATTDVVTLLVSLAIAWWAGGGAAVLLGMARHDGSSLVGQVLRYFSRPRMKS